MSDGMIWIGILILVLAAIFNSIDVHGIASAAENMRWPIVTMLAGS